MQDGSCQYNEQMRRTHGVEGHLRVGLNSGEVVVRAIDTSLHMDYTAVGQVVRHRTCARPTGFVLRGMFH
jgi:class 3 adenylate cyclase